MNALIELVKSGTATQFEHTMVGADHQHQITCHFGGKIVSGRHSDLDAAAMEVLGAIEKHKNAQEAAPPQRAGSEVRVLAFTLRRGEQPRFSTEELCMESDPPQYSTTATLDIGITCFTKTFDGWDKDAMRAVLMENAVRWIEQHEANLLSSK